MPVAIVVNFMKKTTKTLTITSPCKKKSQEDKTLKMFYTSQDLSLDHARTARLGSKPSLVNVDITHSPMPNIV
jgi:hypothetical protein